MAQIYLKKRRIPTNNDQSESHARLSNLMNEIKGKMREQPSEIMRLRTVIENVADSLANDPSFHNVARNIEVLRNAISEE